MPRPRAVVIGGVAGSGKTTVGRLVADRLGCEFVDGDAHHPPENVAKMRRGEGLGDRDRAPWLAALRRAIEDRLDAGRSVVVAASVLTERYRAALVGDRTDVVVVMLHGPRELISERLRQRRGHFADVRLLASQLATLELPGEHAGTPTVPLDGPPEQVAERVVRALEGALENET